MTGESLAIIAVILVMSAMFLRAKKKIVAVLALPVISVPVCYLLSSGLYSLLRNTGLSPLHVTFGLVVVGLVLGSMICTGLSQLIPTRRGRTGYLAFCLIFQCALTLAYVVHLV